MKKLEDVLGIGIDATPEEATEAYKALRGNDYSKRLRKAWKVFWDPYLVDVYRDFGEEALEEAGWFDEAVGPEFLKQTIDDVEMITTPINKIKGKGVVLLSTGGFAPPHVGHLNMMEEAKRALERRGVHVSGGYLSTGNDVYVLTKNYGEITISSEERIELCENAVEDSDWMMNDPWETRYSYYNPNYTEVVGRLQKYLDRHCPGQEVYYVCGSDNAGFALSFRNKNGCVIIPRPGSEHKLEEIKKKKGVYDNPRLLIANTSNKIDMSSSEVRKKMKEARDVQIEEIIKKDQGTYFVRNDLLWAVDKWREKIPGINDLLQEFENGLVSAFKDNLGSHDMHVINVKEQEVIIEKLLAKNEIINLDCITQGNYKINISKVYEVSDGQYFSEEFTNRSNELSLEDQVEKIPKGEYAIVDDDIVTGGTVKIIKDTVGDGIEIVEEISLLDCIKEEYNISNKVIDIVDARDFLIGGKMSGLVVRLPDEQKVRAPYVLPYVNPHSRAIVPVRMIANFSKTVWELNYEFHKRSKLRVRDCDEDSIKLWKYLGFSKNTLLSDICEWHLERI